MTTKIEIGAFSERSIAFMPMFARIAGGAANGLFLSQLFYWCDKGKTGSGWVYKTQAEWTDETGLSRSEQNTARKALKELGLLEDRRAGVPARLYYRLDTSKLAELCGEDYSARHAKIKLAETSELEEPIPANYSDGNDTSNSEITPKISTERVPPATRERAAKPTPAPKQTPEPKKEPTPRGVPTPNGLITAQHPAIACVRAVAIRYPPKSQWPKIVGILGDKPDYDRLKRCFVAWEGKGNRSVNLDWIYDWYVNGIPQRINGYASSPVAPPAPEKPKVRKAVKLVSGIDGQEIEAFVYVEDSR